MQEFPSETQGPFEVGYTASGKPAVYGTEYEAPLCTTDTDSDAHMIATALNRFRPTPTTAGEET